jgi:hypothetical protein
MGIVPAIKQDWRIIPDFLKAPGYEGFFKPFRNRGGIWLNTKFASNMFKGQARQPGIDALVGAGKTCGAILGQFGRKFDFCPASFCPFQEYFRCQPALGRGKDLALRLDGRCLVPGNICKIWPYYGCMIHVNGRENMHAGIQSGGGVVFSAQPRFDDGQLRVMLFEKHDGKDCKKFEIAQIPAVWQEGHNPVGAV